MKPGDKYPWLFKGKRKHNVRPNPDISEVTSCIEIAGTEHTEAPKSIYDLVDEYKILNCNSEECGHDFVSFLKLDKVKQPISANKPKSKVTVTSGISTDGRITASIFHEVVSKVSETYEIKNLEKVKTILSKICGQKNNFKSKATEWGKQMSQSLAENISNLTRKTTKKLML